MPDPTNLLDENCEIASDLKQLVHEELFDEIDLDAEDVDALVRGLVSLLQ